MSPYLPLVAVHFSSLICRLVLVVTAATAVGCAPPPLLEAPGARAVAVGRTADAVALWEALGRAHLVDTGVLRAAGPALDAGAPMVASLLPDGAVLIATRVSAGAAALAPSTPVVGKTAAVKLGVEDALVRVDRNRALVALRVPAGEQATVAALVELMAQQKDAPAIVLPAPGDVAVRIAGAALPFAAGDIDATIRVGPGTQPSSSSSSSSSSSPSGGLAVTVHARAEHPSDDVRAAFAGAPPPWACGLEDGAAAVVSIPPLVAPGGVEDSFAGRLVVALYPGQDGPAFAVAGAPRDAAAADALVEAVKGAGPVSERAAGSARLLSADGKRPLRALVDDGVFMLSAGATPLRARIDAAAPAEARCAPPKLLSLRGPLLARVLLPAFATPAALVRLLAGAADEMPLARLRGVERLDVDVVPDGASLALDARIELAP